MITIIITILGIIFVLGSISPLLVTDDMHDIVAVKQ